MSHRRMFLTLILLNTACTPAVPATTTVPTPAQVSLVRGPYLQSVTPSSVVVAWQTDVPSTGEVAYGEEGVYDLVVADSGLDITHAVTLTGLSAYTSYNYRLQWSDQILSDGYTFRTAAGADQDSFTFVAFGDTRTQDRRHQEVVDLIVGLQPDLVIHTGDLVAHGHSNHQWNTFFEIERNLVAQAPFYPVLGNHEGNNPVYREIFFLPGNESWYSFDYGSVHFVGLQVDDIVDAGPDTEQMAWLRADLEATDRLWKVAFFHVPLHLMRDDDAEEDLAARQDLAALLNEYGVQIAFAGHDHNYQRILLDDLMQVVAGGGGAPVYTLDEAESNLLAYAPEYHAVLITVDGPVLEAVAISVAGEELDRFTIELP